MSFNAVNFQNAKFEHRTADVETPALSEFFDGDPPVWKVRGLSGNEIGRCVEMISNRKAMTDFLADLLNKKTDETINDYVPRENALLIEYFMKGCVNPECNLDIAVKLNEHFATEFNILARKIFELTGLGSEVGKQTPSGETPASEPA